MRSIFKFLFCIPLFVFVGQLYGQSGTGLCISEIMANNQSSISDVDGHFSDWIEIKNCDSVDINLEGWYLSDDPEYLIKWIIPSVTMAPGELLLIFASGKDRRSGELHTNFRLSELGETLQLVLPDGITVQSELAFPTQYPDISYSLFENEYAYSDQPTPGMENVSGDFLNAPIFSVGHGLYDQPFYVSIESREDNGVIRFTLDGSIPGLTNGMDYQEPIFVDSTTVLRASVIKSGKTSMTSTCTYIFPRVVMSQPATIQGYPAEWAPFSSFEGNAPADYEMDPEICQSPEYKDLMVPALRSIPTISISVKADHLFSHSADPDSGGIYIHTDPPTGGLGEDWERPVSAEYILPDGRQGFQIDCGLRIHGGHSRVAEKSPKKSFRLEFDDDYGPDGLKFPLFEDSERDIFNTLILRAGFNQTWFHWDDKQRNAAQYMNDSWSKDMHGELGHVSAHNTFIHLYINGLYWGLYNLSERMDDEFMAYYLGGDRQNYDVIKDYAEVAEGNMVDWNQLMLQADRGFEDSGQYYLLEGKDQNGNDDPMSEALLDIDNLIDYMLLNFYMGNKDWDHHNWIAFRNRVNPGSGFKFAPWDSERTFNGINENMVDENNEYRPSYLYSQLRKNSLFRKRFAERANEVLGPTGMLGPDSVKKVWMKRAKELDLAIIAESARWGDYRRDMHQHKSGPYLLYSKNSHWLVEQNRLVEEYFPERSGIVLKQLAEVGLAGEVVTELTEQRFSALHASYPNPFSNHTTIRLQGSSASTAELNVFDSNGKFIEQIQPSSQTGEMVEFTWYPEALENGLYFYRITSNDNTIRGKMLYIK